MAPADYPLTPQGRESAVRLVPVLTALGIEQVYSSPYQRAVDTVAPFALGAGFACELDSELRERRLADRATFHLAALASHGQWTSLLLNALDPGFGVEEWLAIPNPAVFQVDLEARTWQAVPLVEAG